MKFYLAPMEGVTGYVFRNAYKKHFEDFDTYFAPFVVPNQNQKIKLKELKDILKENNRNMDIVPQILTNNEVGFKNLCEKFKELGYTRVNLNLGCPSGTVSGKGRGSGFLKDRDTLDKFLEEIYKIPDMKISIKTRLGFNSSDEFYEIIKIYNKYPLDELIIHPRTRNDFYKGKPNLEMFREGLNQSKAPVCYNGDIFTEEDFKRITEEFNIDRIMLGRGILKNPGLLNKIKTGKSIDKWVIKEFQEDIFNGYKEIFNEEISPMFRLKELWGYMSHSFIDGAKYKSDIMRAQRVEEFKRAVLRLLEETELNY